jgi:hypothetical protein
VDLFKKQKWYIFNGGYFIVNSIIPLYKQCLFYVVAAGTTTSNKWRNHIKEKYFFAYYNVSDTFAYSNTSLRRFVCLFVWVALWCMYVIVVIVICN